MVSVTPDLVENAVDTSFLNQISLWDSLIICSAKISNCSELITEDLKDGQIIQGVRVVNPFV